jgi:hypothetical protein
MSTVPTPPQGGTMIVPPQVLIDALKIFKDTMSKAMKAYQDAMDKAIDDLIRELEEIQNPPPPEPVIVDDGSGGATSQPDPYT